ncbi:putative monooxygenase YcnE isoform X2 [Convolutriloba macropyga]|uniref:putative monooxygenase YcnE isoform X2 n=1 Tax=Convolutriloba macropyga TaxID=536237 RepID=UPI003F522BC6
MTSHVRVHASLVVKDAASFLQDVKVLIEATQKEQGCVSYQLFKQAGTKNTFALVEEWSSMEDIEAHEESEHVTKFIELQKENFTIDNRMYTLVEFE